jgi:hypothetical protein
LQPVHGIDQPALHQPEPSKAGTVQYGNDELRDLTRIEFDERLTSRIGVHDTTLKGSQPIGTSSSALVGSS